MALFLAGRYPRRCGLPTGAGKTHVITLWLLALIYHLEQPDRFPRPPRRLVFVVDRRALVDQATDLAEALLYRLQNPDDSNTHTDRLHSMAAALRNAGTLPDEKPFAVSTLRGQFADNGEWYRDPARAAIVIGTVDMVGSRLLFSAYRGAGRYRRSLFAGVLAQDSLIVVDEAHLSGAFVDTLGGIESAQRDISFRCRVLLLSATLGGEAQVANTPPQGDVFVFDPSLDLSDDMLRSRWQSPKRLRLMPPCADASELAAKIAVQAVELASGCFAVAIFVNTVKLAQEVRALLGKTHSIDGDQQIALLTGEMRGAERDVFARNPIFLAFQAGPGSREQTKPLFLITTAAGEVGIDFDADHAVCDLVSLDRMIQRLGRVNRRGDGDAIVALIPSTTSLSAEAEDAPPEDQTYHALLSLHPGADGCRKVSPEALAQSEIITRYPLACEFQAPPPPLDIARLDDWSMTSIDPSYWPRPLVSYWLRGIVPDDFITTWLCWRADLVFAPSDDGKKDALRMTAIAAPHARELAQIATPRAVDLLAKLSARTKPGQWIVFLDPAGNREAIDLASFGADKKTADFKKALFPLLAYRTVFLPSSLGGLDLQGHIDEQSTGWVSDQLSSPDEKAPAWERVLIGKAADHSWRVSSLPLQSSAAPDKLDLPPFETVEAAVDAAAIALETNGHSIRHVWTSGSDTDDPETGPNQDGSISSAANGSESDAPPAPINRVVYFARASADLDDEAAEDLTALAKQDVTLTEHTARIVGIARQMTTKIGLPKDLAEAVVLAAERHDMGKNRAPWQRAIGNRDMANPLAKSHRHSFNHSITQGYRHEFGSLVEVSAHIANGTDPVVRDHPRRELILHLIAAHHGYGRPDFRVTADPASLPSQTLDIAHAAALRFAHLQRELGHWQLAWLESLVKCADALASAHPENAATIPPQ